ncbi:MAG: hypothetical protein K8R19_04180, partial [Methanosarcinales archaeon]|nr:hypothetical protein [Methanosarcinales archaeon]
SWQAGSGNNTDSYNVSINNIWHNDTFDLFYNNSGMSQHEWSNITVFAYNSSGTGTLNLTPVSETVQIPNNDPVLASIGDKTVTEGQWLNFTVSATDEDSDPITYGSNKTNGDFDSNTGIFTWLTELGDNGIYTWYFNSIDDYGGLDTETITVTVDVYTPTTYIPPTPTTLINEKGNFYVNHSWQAGSGNNTDSYNVSINNIWHNDTFDLFYNNSGMSQHEWSNITVFAYNSSGTGTLNLTPVSETVQIPNNDPVLASIGDKTVTEGQWLNFTVSATDEDSDPITYGSNKTNGDFDSNTGIFTWLTELGDNGIYTWYFNSIDDYGGLDTETITVTVDVYTPTTYIPPTPTTLINEKGNFYVNHSWQAGSGNNTDSYNVSINGSWTNGTSATFKNSTVGPHGYAEIIVYAFNSSGSGTLSVGNLTDNVTVPNNPIDITNTSDRTVNEGENVYVDFDYTDDDSDTGTFTCNRNDLFSDFDTATGKGNWLTNYSSDGTYSVVFGVSDGYGSTDSYTMTITVNDVDSPPVISNVNNDTASNNSVTIYWDTDIPSDSLVKYGKSNNIESLNNETNDPTLVTNHYIVLTNLEDNTTYYYVVNSTSAFDKSNQSDDIKTFTTTDINDITPPVINDKSLSKTSSVKSGETLTVTINVIDNIGVTSVTASNNDLTRRNATHWSGTVTADLTKKVDIIAYDAAGNTNTTTLTYTLYTSSGGGGGGGGGGTSGEAFENIVCTE